MKQTLEEFILDWNKAHYSLIFSVDNLPTGRPASIYIRYTAARYQNILSAHEWAKLNSVVETKSHGTMYIATSERLFERGIINIEIASSNHNYQEQLIIGVLRWIGEKFFAKEDGDIK